MIHFLAKPCLIVGLLAVLRCAVAQPLPPLAPDARLALDYLSNDINLIATAGGSWEAQRTRERQVAEALRQHGRTRPDDTSLAEPDKNGMFPLAYASLNGFALVVEALLESPAVRRQVNTPSLAGATPLVLAQIARPLTFWACDPYLLHAQSPEVIQVARQRELYFATATDKPFDHIQRLLTEAGATLGTDDLERSWRKFCPRSTSEASESLFRGSDPTAALTAIAERNWARHQRTQERKAAASLETLSLSLDGIPEAVSKTPRPVATPVPQLTMDTWSGNRVCRAMAKPEVGQSWPWGGTASVRAVVTLQGGLPVSVDVRRVDGNMSESANRSLAWLVSRAITLTECRGELRYELAFAFNVVP